MAERRDLFVWDGPDSSAAAAAGHNHSMANTGQNNSNTNGQTGRWNDKYHQEPSTPTSSVVSTYPQAMKQNVLGCFPGSSMNRNQDLQCPTTPNSFSPPTTSSMNNQLVVPQPLKPIKAKKSYQCKMCDQSNHGSSSDCTEKFESKSLVYQHGKEKHGLEDKAHPCQHCYKSFASPSQLNQHSLVHTGERKYHCKYCSKAFKQLSHLQQHTRIHTGEKPYRCSMPNCNKAFAQLSNLQHHQRNHDNNKAKASRKSFYCTVCQRGFVTESSLDKHISRLHAHLSQHSSSSKTSTSASSTLSLSSAMALTGHSSPPAHMSANLSGHGSPPAHMSSNGPGTSAHQMSPGGSNMNGMGLNLSSHGHHGSGGLHGHPMTPGPNGGVGNDMNDERCGTPMGPLLLRPSAHQDLSHTYNNSISSTSQRPLSHNAPPSMSMTGTHTGLPPISRLSERCFPIGPPLPAAALSAIRASALSLNYSSPAQRSPIGSMHHRSPSSPNTTA